jgi:hypothetical protein
MERNRARLPHSDSGRLIWPTVIFTSHGAAAKAPIASNAIAVAWRMEGLILSAIRIPKPSPIAVLVSMSKGATGSSSDVFEMDIREDIAYHYTARSKNENGIFEPRIHKYLNVFSSVFHLCESVA